MDDLAVGVVADLVEHEQRRAGEAVQELGLLLRGNRRGERQVRVGELELVLLLEQPVEGVALLEVVDEGGQELGGHVDVVERERHAVHDALALHVLDLVALRDPQLGGHSGARGDALGLDDVAVRLAAQAREPGEAQVVLQVRVELVELGAHEGALAAVATEHVVVHEVLDGAAHGYAAHPVLLAELRLRGEPLARPELAGKDLLA